MCNIRKHVAVVSEEFVALNAIGDIYVQVGVVVIIVNRAGHGFNHYPKSRTCGYIGKGAVTIVFEEFIGPEEPVYNEVQVFPAIVVIIKKNRLETGPWWQIEAYGFCYFGKSAVAVVAVEVTTVLYKREIIRIIELGNVEIQITIVVVVAPGRAEMGEDAVGYSGSRCHFGKGLVVVLPPQPHRCQVVGDEQVTVPIVIVVCPQHHFHLLVVCIGNARKYLHQLACAVIEEKTHIAAARAEGEVIMAVLVEIIPREAASIVSACGDIVDIE